MRSRSLTERSKRSARHMLTTLSSILFLAPARFTVRGCWPHWVQTAAAGRASMICCASPASHRSSREAVNKSGSGGATSAQNSSANPSSSMQVNRSSKRFWAKAYYSSQRERGKSHQAAVRALAFKWIRIIFRCWQTKTAYNEVTYLESLRKKGSPLLSFAANNPS